MGIVVSEAQPEDIPEISRIHLLSFPNYFSSNFGNNFLNIYFRNYQSNPAHLLLVAKNKSKTIGFISGTIDSELLYQNLYKTNFVSIVKIACKQFLSNKNFRTTVFRKKDFIVKAIRSKFMRKGLTKKSVKPTQFYRQGTLLLIAVIEEFRGRGVAVDLIREFEAEMKRRGVSVCTLSVKRDNLRGINFYKKAGWQIAHETEDLIKFKKILSSNN